MKESEKKLAQLREEIDGVDSEIVRLLTKRADLAFQVGVAKAGAPVYRPDREKEILERIKKEAGALESRWDPVLLETVFREIISGCRSQEAVPAVAYLGPEGTFTEMAVLAQFGHGVRTIPCANIDSVFHACENGQAEFAVVPIENSTQGTITRTLDLLFKTPLKIIAEIQVPIRHNLMSLTGQAEDVRSIGAHPQALAQCRQWLSAHFGSVPQKAEASNGDAAKKAAQDRSMAAIASTRAADLYGLKVISSGIQDEPNNSTRFVVMSLRAPKVKPSPLIKTSIVFSVDNKAGALLTALEPMKHHDVSMMRLESRPACNGAWEYNFYVDIEGCELDEKVSKTFRQMRQLTAFFKILGAYPRAK